MAKQVLPHAELLGRVQQLLDAHPLECGRVCLDGLDIRDDQSPIANWHVDWTRASAPESEIQACRLKIGQELDSLRRAYDCEVTSPPVAGNQPRLW